MSTPTPSHPSQPSSASRKATGHVTTPSHLGLSSPAPRSVPSPATTRKDQAGKTPVSHPTTSSSQGSKTLSSTPMVQNLSQQGTTSSPGANMLSFGTPIGLGVDGTTPAMIGGVPMATTLSELGLSASGVQKRNEEEERRARMRKVLKSIGEPKGRVSEEGIARVSRRVGFANDIDAEKLPKGELEKRVGNRAISIAGNTVVLDIELKDQKPQSVHVLHSKPGKALEEEGQAAGKVLLLDLTPPDGVMLHAKLDKFAMNLDRLARIDRLSNNDINCFEAMAGLYASLRRLYEQERQAAEDLDVMCKKSGRPVLHACSRLGLVLEYWQDGHRTSGETRGESAMEVNDKQSHEEPEHQTYNLYIQPEASPASLYPSLRVSDAWLPDPLEVPAATSSEGIPWQDPPHTLVPASIANGAGAANTMALDDSEQKLPDLRFVAHLDPPIIVPFQIANNILPAFGLPLPQVYVMHCWHHMILHSHPPPANTTTADDLHITATQSVLSANNSDGEKEIRHRYDLEVLKPDLGFKIEELPFSHPRQLVEILPTLRQWACFGSLVKNAFAVPESNNQDIGDRVNRNAQSGNQQLSLQDLLTPPTTQPDFAIDGVTMSISLLTSPVPSLSISFPAGKDGELRNLNVQVLPNSEIDVTEASSDVEMTDQSDDAKAKKAAKALEVCGDLGVWLEWMRMHHS